MSQDKRHYEPRPDRHAMWAGVALRNYIFQRDGNMDEYFADPRSALVDLLADLRHWAQAEKIDFHQAEATALDHYREECG